jgi:hypothetical protein
MESNIVAGIAGLVLSLFFGYVPGARSWFEALDGVRKAQVMAGLLILSALIIYGGACYTPWQAVECAEAGFWKLAELLGAALLANQAAYPLLVKPTRTAVERG